MTNFTNGYIFLEASAEFPVYEDKKPTGYILFRNYGDKTKIQSHLTLDLFSIERTCHQNA